MRILKLVKTKKQTGRSVSCVGNASMMQPCTSGRPHHTQQEILGQQVASFLEGEKDDKNVVVWPSGY
jgi:hypothetical protein